MPIYEFDCEQCGERFEELVAGGAAAPACPRCGSQSTVHRLSPVSPPSRQPRGAGVRAGESRRREREAARSERLAETKRRRAAGEI
jgi:putative FmdB family regulatory protein